MQRSIITIILVVVALIALTLGFKNAERNGDSQEESRGKDSYTSETYGFSFAYPNRYEHREYAPEAIAIGTGVGWNFTSLAEVRLYRSPGDAIYADFDAFVLASVKSICAAVIPAGTVSCDRMLRREAFVTDTDVSGMFFFVERSYRDPATGTQRQEEFGPIIAFDISAYLAGLKTVEQATSTMFTALIVHPSAHLAPSAVEGDLVDRVAESVELKAVNDGAAVSLTE
jgi:hypothetical protein